MNRRRNPENETKTENEVLLAYIFSTVNIVESFYAVCSSSLLIASKNKLITSSLLSTLLIKIRMWPSLSQGHTADQTVSPHHLRLNCCLSSAAYWAKGSRFGSSSS